MTTRAAKAGHPNEDTAGEGLKEMKSGPQWTRLWLTGWRGSHSRRMHWEYTEVPGEGPQGGVIHRLSLKIPEGFREHLPLGRHILLTLRTLLGHLEDRSCAGGHLMLQEPAWGSTRLKRNPFSRKAPPAPLLTQLSAEPVAQEEFALLSSIITDSIVAGRHRAER